MNTDPCACKRLAECIRKQWHVFTHMLSYAEPSLGAQRLTSLLAQSLIKGTYMIRTGDEVMR